MFLPPYSSEASGLAELQQRGYAILRPAAVRAQAGVDAADLTQLQADWLRLERDDYLLDGGSYRWRRHASFVLQANRLRQVPRRAHWQPRSYNALHGGLQRWFAPVAPQTMASATWQGLLCWLGRVASQLHGEQTWYGEAHQFRIDTSGGIGRPTPEGAHRDGVDFVAVFLVERQGIKGGETRVFELDGPAGQRFTLEEPWAALLLDDNRVIHETTPIQPLQAGAAGHRDTLVVTLRAGGFLAPQA